MTSRFVSFTELADRYKTRGWSIEDTEEAFEELVKSKSSHVEAGALIKISSFVDDLCEFFGRKYATKKCQELRDLANRQYEIELRRLEEVLGQCPDDLEEELRRRFMPAIRPIHFQQDRVYMHASITPPEKGTKARKMWDSWKRRARNRKAQA